MSSSYAHEPLRAVPPLDGQRRRFALLLQLKDALHTARNAAAVASGQAAAFLARLVTRLHLQTPLSWVRSTTAHVISTGGLVARRLGMPGAAAAAAAVAVVTSPTARRALRPLVAGTACTAQSVLWAAARAADRGLRLFGAPGSRVADALGRQVAHLQVRLDQLLAPLAQRRAELVHPAAAHVRLVAGLARSYLLHLTLRATIRSAVVRLLVEGVVLPLLVNSRLGQSLRSVVAPPHASGRTAHRPAGPEAPEAAATGPELPPADPTGAPTETTEVAVAPDEDEEPPAAPEPLNRAERRAQHRQQARNRRTPRT